MGEPCLPSRRLRSRHELVAVENPPWISSFYQTISALLINFRPAPSKALDVPTVNAVSNLTLRSASDADSRQKFR